MLRFSIIVFLLQLTIVQHALAQLSASLFVPGFEGDNLQGEQGGIGPDGTTFVLSGTVTTDGFVAPFTMTVVEAASQVVEIAAIRTGNAQNDIVGVGVDCELAGNNANCIQVYTLAGGGGATTVQSTIPIQPTVVPILNAQGGSVPTLSNSQSAPSGTSSIGGNGGNGGNGENSSGNGGPGLDDGSNTSSPASPTGRGNNVPPGLIPKSGGILISIPLLVVAICAFL